MIKRINIKDDHPPADIAISRLLSEIEVCHIANEKLLKVVHGYGASGVGGEIKKQMEIQLSHLKKEGKIYDYIKGECFCATHPKYEDLKVKYPELILDSDLSGLNSGITLIILKK